MNAVPNNNPNSPDPPPAPDPLAVALSKLDPAPHGFEWNALMFAAGRESKARALLFWRIATVICALAACGFAFAYFTQQPATAPAQIVYIERDPARGPAPPAVIPSVPGPVVPPNVTPEPKPEPSTLPRPLQPSDGPSEWSFEPPPAQGSAAKWFNTRNEVLTVGLSVLPDPGHKAPPPRTEAPK